MKKRFTAVILALLLSLSMIPSGALAAEEGIEAQNLEIPREGLTITEEMGNAVYTAGSGTITWDAASKTLTLDNATIGELNKRPDFGIKFKGTTPTDYTIKLVGSNVIDYSIEGICLFNHNSTLTIQGDGTLHIDNLSTTDGWTTYGIGTYFFDRNTNSLIEYNSTVIIAGGTVETTQIGTKGYGVYMPAGNLLVTGGTLKIGYLENTRPMLTGIKVIDGLFRVTGGTVDVNAYDAGIEAAAVRIDGGMVTAKSTNIDKYAKNNGICVDKRDSTLDDAIAEAGGINGTLMINGGTVNAVGALNGLYSDDIILLYGGNVTATTTGIGLNTFSPYSSVPIKTGTGINCESHPGMDHIYIPSSSTRTPEDGKIYVNVQTAYTHTLLLNADDSVPETVTITGADATPHKVTVVGTGTDGITEGVRGYYLTEMNVLIQAGTTSEPFSHWTASPEVNFNSATANRTTFKMPSSDVTVTANWGGGTPDPDPDPDPDPTKYAVTVADTKESGFDTGAGEYTAGSVVNINAGSSPFYDFTTWTADSDDVTFANAASAATSFIMPAHAVTVTAGWKSNLPVLTKYTLTLENVGSYAKGAGEYAAGSQIIPDAGAKFGLTFKEWQTESTDITFTKHEDGLAFIMPAHAVTLTAVWEYIPYTVEIRTPGEGAVGAGTYKMDDTVTLNAGTRPGYTFSKWKAWDGQLKITDPEKSDGAYFIMPPRDITVEAVWTANKYAVTMEGIDGAVGASGQGEYTLGQRVSLYAGTKTGYTFKNWTTTSTDITISNVNSASATFTMPGHAVTVTANWERNDVPLYDVTVTGGGEEASASGSCAQGDKVTINAGTRAGYTFAGWVVSGVTLTSNNNSPTATFTMPAGPVSLKACWTPEPVNGVLTLNLDELPGPVTINYEGYTCENEGSVRHLFSGKNYVLTQKSSGAATANTVTVNSNGNHTFAITLKGVNIAGTNSAAFSVKNRYNKVNLTLEGANTLKGGANHAALELVSDTGYDQTTVTIQGQGSLNATGGTGGAGIGGSLGDNFGVIEIAGGTITAQGGAGAAGIGGGSCYANGGTGLGCANSTGNEVRITGGTVTATAGTTSGSLHGAAGIGTGEGAALENGVTTGGPYVSVRISGGDVTAQGAGQAPAIGGTYVGNIRITGGTVTTRANANCATEIGIYPGVTSGCVREVRLADDSTGKGNAVVYVTKADVIDDKPSGGYAADNYDWNGIVYWGSEGQLYVSVNAKTNIVERDSLTVPTGKTLNIPEGVTVKLPADGTVSGKLAGKGWVQIGEAFHYAKADGTLAPCEVYYTGVYPRPFNTLKELLTTWSAYLTTSNNHIRLLTDVTYPEDMVFTHCTQLELDLNGHTLNMGNHQINAKLDTNPSVSPLLTISDSSAGKTGKITGSSANPLVLSPDGCLTITGGAIENTGAGPAVEFAAVREGSSKLTGGTFSRIQISATQGSEPAPLTSLLGSGLAFYDKAAEVWISPVSKKAELSTVSVLAKALPSLRTSHTQHSNEATITGLTGDASAYQWLYNKEKDGTAEPLAGAIGPVLYLDDGTLPDHGYVSCKVTVNGETILTDPVYVSAEQPVVNIIVAGGPYTYNGKPHTPAVTVKTLSDVLLVEGEDYALTYENNARAGQAFAVITSLKEGAIFTTARKSFVIAKASLTIQAADQTVQQASAVQSGVSMVRADGLAEGDTLAGVTISASGQQTVPSGAVIRNAAGEDVTSCYGITYRSGVLTITGGGSGDTPGTNPGGNGGSSSGGGSSDRGSSSNGGGGTRNPDGSVTTTRTDRVTGAVTETTRYPDGSVITVVTAKDGAKTITTTQTDSAGVQTTTVERPDGTSAVTARTEDGTTAKTEISAEGRSESTVTLSRQAVAAARGEAVSLPLPAVRAQSGSAQASTVTIEIPGGGTVRAAIPVANMTAGTVAVLVRPDGGEEVIKRTLPGEEGIVFPVESGATVKIVDNAKNFADVPAGYWAASSVDFVTSRELFLGTSETSFSPGRAVTRGMLMTVLARLDGQDTSGGDVWYAPGMNWAVAKGVSDGSAPEADISREQLVVMLYRYAGSPTPPNLLLDFADADQVGAYAADAMRWAVAQGILQGKTDSLLAPKDPATRAQVARMLENFLKSL